jgi:hypothetical protein
MKHKSSVGLKQEENVLWRPSYSWYLKTSAMVLGFLTVIFLP